MIREEFILAWYRTGQGRCFYCGALFGEGDTLFAKSIEHVYPKHTYKFMRYNEVQACRGCNFAKNGFEPVGDSDTSTALVFRNQLTADQIALRVQIEDTEYRLAGLKQYLANNF